MSERYVPVKDRDDIYRDAESNAIISDNVSAYESRKRVLRNKSEKENELNNLKGEVKELKDLVLKLLEKDSTK